MMFTRFQTTTIAFVLLFSMTVNAQPNVILQNLDLTCHKIPKQQQQLCYAKIRSPYGPYDDVVLYRKNDDDQLFLLGLQNGTVSTYGGVGFSTGGLWMWSSWAEEGHPYFVFYKTRDFIEEGFNAIGISSFGDLIFDGIYSFKDTGEFRYYVYSEQHKNCVDFVKEGTETICIKQFHIFKDREK
jgi:hypothetical protein